MNRLFFLSFFFLTSVIWASSPDFLLQDADYRRQQSEKYSSFFPILRISTNTEVLFEVTESSVIAPKVWIVWKDSEIYLLNDFVKSGKFCKYLGHHFWVAQEWDKTWYASPLPDGCGGWVNAPQDRPDLCALCGRCRKRMKISKEEME